MSRDPPPPGAPKETWRDWARGVRRELDMEDLARAVVDHLAGWLSGTNRSRILTYLAMPGEIDLLPLTRRLPDASFCVTRTPRDGWLTVHPLEAEMERHPFGFPQPTASAPEVPPGLIEVVLVPGLVFDRSGGRIGHGRGYFDQLLGRLPPEAWRVGITPSACVVDRLPVTDDDVRMTHLGTEDGVGTVEPS